jgi:hypothetical protein
MKTKINYPRVKSKILNNKITKNKVFNIINTKFIREKNNFISSYENHPVTQELNLGPAATNISNTLGGYGNLYSYIGFPVGFNPTQKVLSLLKTIQLLKTVQIRKETFSLKAKIPSQNDFLKVSRMPWESGRSWLFDIEKGISGLSAYLYGNFEASRSGKGIQVKNYKDKIFRPIPYFRFLYDKFLIRIKSFK